MCNSGGSPPPMPAPPAPTYTATDGTVFNDYNQYNSYEQNLRAQNFASSRDAAVNRARTGATSYAQSLGLGEDYYSPLIESEIGNTVSGIPNLDPNPGSYFSPNFGETLFGREQNKLRTQYSNQTTGAFPTNFSAQTFGDPTDDAIINTLFSEQYDPAKLQLDRAKARGNLTDVGYTSALGKLDQQGQQARSKLQSTGADVRNTYIGQANDIAGRARGAAQGYTLGSTPFDLAPYTGEYDTLKSKYNTNLEGDLRNALGGQSLFDVPLAMNAGNIAQGVSNESGNLLDAILARRTKRESSRGLGSTGAF